MKYSVTIGDKQFEIGIGSGDGAVTVNGRDMAVDMLGINGGKLQSLLADNRIFEFEIERSNGGISVWHGSAEFAAEVVDEKTERLRQLMGAAGLAKKQSVLRASMPGLILKVEVVPGQKVKKGDGLMIVEAMKMENEIKALGPGVVKEIKAKERQAIEKGQVLIVFE